MKQIPILPLGDLAVTPRKGPDLYKHIADFSVVILGSGCPVAVMGRSHPSALVQYKGNYFLVDVGEGTTMRLAEGGIPVGAMKNIFFTHHHADHDAGYNYLMISSWMNGRTDLELVGPPKTRALHEMYVNYYAEDLKYRSALEGSPLAAMYEGNIREFEDKGEFDLDGVHITTAKLTHTEHNIGYRFEVDGKVIVISGDTSYDPALVELAKGADLLVMDSGPMPTSDFLGAKPAGGGGKKPHVANQVDDGLFAVPPHPLKGEVARIATEAGVKTLILTHYSPVQVDEEKAKEQFVAEGFHGNVVFSRDLMEITP